MGDDKLAVIEVLEKLGALGSADHIALFLEEEGIKGHLTNSESCPITNYIERETDAVVTTGRYSMSIEFGCESVDFVEKGGDFGLLPQYEAVSYFVRNFDEEEYPNLIEKEE